MSKAKDNYYKFKAESDNFFGGLQPDITDYIKELEKTISRFEKMCYKCEKMGGI